MENLLAGVLGILLGALIQYWLGVQQARKQKALDFRTAAYADLLDAISAAVFAQRKGDRAAEQSALARVTAAKARIVVSADRKTIRAIAAFWRLGGNIGSEAQREAFIAMLQAMRERDCFHENADNNDLMTIVLGVDAKQSALSVSDK